MIAEVLGGSIPSDILGPMGNGSITSCSPYHGAVGPILSAHALEQLALSSPRPGPPARQQKTNNNSSPKEVEGAGGERLLLRVFSPLLHIYAYIQVKQFVN